MNPACKNFLTIVLAIVVSNLLLKGIDQFVKIRKGEVESDDGTVEGRKLSSTNAV